MAGALINGGENRLFIHRHVQRLAHFKLVERGVAHVVGDVAEVETRLVDQLQFWIALQRVDIRRAWMQGDLALASLELLHAHRGVGVDRENQVIELYPARVPELFISGVADFESF